MGEKETKESRKHKRPNLEVPRAEAADKIKSQIEKGRQIVSQFIPPDIAFFANGNIDKTKAECNKWSAYNTELLKRLFSDNSIADGYAQLDVLLAVNAATPNDLRKRIDKDVGQLESILERLELIPELTRISQTEENVGAEEKRHPEKWYQSRANQAAMITGICIIVGAILTSQWWLPFYDKIDESPAPRTHRAKRSGQEVNAKQPIHIIPSMPSGDLEKSITDLRVSKKLRELTPLETGRSISQTPPGTYFFVHPIYLTFVRDDFKKFLNRAIVDSYKSYRSSVEFQIDHEQQMFIVVYVSDEAAARLTEAKRSSLEEMVLSSTPWGNFRNLAIVPIKRICKSSYRSISIADKQTVGVLDIVLE